MSVIRSVQRPSRRNFLRTVGAGGLAAIAAGGLGRGALAVESDPLPRVVLEWLGAWESDDPAGNLAALYAADGSYGDVPYGADVLGPQIEEYLRGALAGLKLLGRYPRTAFAIDGLAVAEQLYWGTNDGYVPNSVIGAEFQIYATTIFEFDDRSLLRTTDYYDSASILSQFGALQSIPFGDCKSG